VYFLPHWLRTGWQSAISQGKTPRTTLSWQGIEPEPQGGQTVRYINFPTELSWLALADEKPATYTDIVREKIHLRRKFCVNMAMHVCQPTWHDSNSISHS